MIRATLGGEQMAGIESRGVAEHIRVYLPHAETGELPMPVMGPEGMNFPEDQDRPTSRAYTPRRWYLENNEVDVDFVIHGEGPASAWASTIKPGDTAVISGQPGGAYQPEMDVDWYVIGGDEAAIPAIATLLEVLPPAMRVHVYAEVLDEEEEQEITPSSQAQITWLHRNSANELPGRKLAAAMRDVELPEGDGRVWVSCEASVMRGIKADFLERGVDRSMLRVQGYWKAGDVNHTDHDMGDDV